MALITENGLNKLKKELASLEEDEQVTLQAVSFARSLGDFSENAELDAARNDLERIQGKIAELKSEITSSVIFDVMSINHDIIGFNATVTLEDDNGEKSVYTLVHNSESDVSKNKISFYSPLGQAMAGKRVGDSFSFTPPAGEKTYDVLEIDYSNCFLEKKD
ncbi:transcription elongation factor GreA [Alphaproteobacteria bacterium endosymbiont of Tiliacea citrago]|uniref:GreA/GreB family elongation factor n=1 Tax=Alphaproteobacteria bacterium endosymbiont of Tiliacea citrago TaxID=3077944 RepID=UPI00313BED91